MSLDFIPRNLAKPSKRPQKKLPVSTTHKFPISTPSEASSSNSRNVPESEAEDCVIHAYMSLSNHAVWSDSELVKTLEKDPQGFIPLSYLLRCVSIILDAPTENAVVKLIRARADDVLDVRLLTTAPEWTGKGKGRAGAYEVRAKAPGGAFVEYSEEYWEGRTIYMENIPIQYRTVPGIMRFTLSLLSQTSLKLIQNVTLPPHHQDTSSDAPKCKGFAFVALTDPADVETLLHSWPWTRTTKKIDAEESPVVFEARKFGFRAISKKDWGELKKTYLAYRQNLVEEAVAFELSAMPTRDTPTTPKASVPTLAPTDATNTSTTTLSSPYPFGCLVFVRNVHPETNKTTLRTLFSRVFEGNTPGVDYVDFNKGMDSCHLRLATLHHTQLLVSHFTKHPAAQTTGLDDTGSASPSNQITMEVVQGKMEELYWEKVPEKVRRQAVQKAVNAHEGANNDTWGADEGNGRRDRKRKRYK